MKNIIGAILVLIIFVLTSFLSGCGSAEPVEFYTYTTSMPKLGNAVKTFFKNNSNPNVVWDTSSYLLVRRYRNEFKDKTWYTTAMDTIRPSKYRGEYDWITIKEKETVNNYCFTLFLLPSSKSAIVIKSLWNNKGLDLRQGENVGDFTSHEAKKSKSLFEKEFVNRLDKELNLKHSIGRPFWDQ